MNARSLEDLLSLEAAEISYPPTPDLTASVVSRLRAGSRPRGRLYPATIALLFLALGVFVLVLSPTGDAIARFFGVQGSRIEIVPSPAPGVSPTPFPTPAGLGDYGNESTLIEAAAQLGFAPALPGVTDALVASFLVSYGDQHVLVLQYPTFDLWQTRLEQQASFGKLVNRQPREVSVAGEPGLWLSGDPHFFSYMNAAGVVVEESRRTVDRNTLIWRTSTAFYRIETKLSLDDALRIANTLP